MFLLRKTSTFAYLFKYLVFFMPLQNKTLFYLHVDHVDHVIVICRDAFVVFPLVSVFWEGSKFKMIGETRGALLPRVLGSRKEVILYTIALT